MTRLLSGDILRGDDERAFYLLPDALHRAGKPDATRAMMWSRYLHDQLGVPRVTTPSAVASG
jgi:hypothetical protein